MMKLIQTVLCPVLCFSLLTLVSPASAQNKDNGRKYADVAKLMDDLAAKNSATTKTFILGDSDSGQKIKGVQIGSGPIHNLVVSTHHGNEYGSTEVAIAFATALATKPISGQTVYVIPVLNISGYNARDREEMSSGTFATSYDPNRNYPSPCGTEGPFTLKDTAALASFIDKENIVASATLHTFSPAVTYPWGFSTPDLMTGYESIFKGMVTEATRDSHYPTGNTTDLIYAANGSFEDYAFLEHGIWSILFELGTTHSPNANQLQELIRGNVDGLRRMMESAPTQRASSHAFTGKCETRKNVMRPDLHNE